jgi:hypothetical protein
MNIFELSFILPSSRSFVNATKYNNKKNLERGFVGKHRLLNHNIPRLTGRAWQKSSSQTPSAPAHSLTLNSMLLSTPAGPLCPHAGPDHPCSEVYVWVLTEVPLLCLLQSNTSSGSSLRLFMCSHSWYLGILSGYGESALDRVCIVCTLTIRVNSSNLFQPLHWNLVQPAHPVTTEGEWEAAEKSQGPPCFTKHPPDSTRCTSNWTPANTESSGQEQAHISTVLSLMSTHTLSISCST